MRRSCSDQGSLAEKASKALGWSLLNNIVARLSTMGIGVALARLLGPHEFGAFAVSMVALLAVLSFNELGVSLAIVRWEDDPGEIAPTVTTISVVSSVIIYLGCFFGAPAFATAMGSPGATNVIRVLAINVVVDGLVSTPAALMQRYFRQDKKMIADQLNTWVGAAVSIGLAIMHFGAMSLAVGRLAGSLVAAVVFIAFSPLPLRFGFDREKAGALFRFGMPLAGASIIVFAVQNADQLIVGKLLGATALGYYALAFNISSWPLNIFAVPVRSVAPALFSRLQQDRPAMRSGFLTGLRLLESATLPVCLLISGAAIPVVRFVYGGRWEPAAAALAWLAGLAAIRILFEFIYDFFVVLAKSRVVFTVQLVWLVVLVPALVIGARVDGIAGAGMAEVAVALCIVLPWYLAELGRVSIGSLAVAGRLALPLVYAAAVYVAALAISHAVHNALGACLLAGFFTLAVVGLLGYRMRGDVTGLRAALRQPQPSQAARQPQPRLPSRRPADAQPPPATVRFRPAPAGAQFSEPGPGFPSRPYPPAGQPGHPPVGQPGDPPAGRPGWPQLEPSRPHEVPRGRVRRLAAITGETVPIPAIRDVTGPLEMYRDRGAWTPIFQQTVNSQRWDPLRSPRDRLGQDYPLGRDEDGTAEKT